MPALQIKWSHKNRHPFIPLTTCNCCGWAGAYPSCHWAGGRVPLLDALPVYRRDTERQTTIASPMNLRCLWTVGGNRSIWRKPTLNQQIIPSVLPNVYLSITNWKVKVSKPDRARSLIVFSDCLIVLLDLNFNFSGTVANTLWFHVTHSKSK